MVLVVFEESSALIKLKKLAVTPFHVIVVVVKAKT